MPQVGSSYTSLAIILTDLAIKKHDKPFSHMFLK